MIQSEGWKSWVVALRELSSSNLSNLSPSHPHPSLSGPHDLNLEGVAAPSHGGGSRFFLARLEIGSWILKWRMLLQELVKAHVTDPVG